MDKIVCNHDAPVRHSDPWLRVVPFLQLVHAKAGCNLATVDANWQLLHLLD